MKADKAPEKIILSADRETGILYDEWVINDYTDSIKIEYTRTDTFIEKAENYLRNKCQRFILTEKDIEDFKNYMKGK